MTGLAALAVALAVSLWLAPPVPVPVVGSGPAVVRPAARVVVLSVVVVVAVVAVLHGHQLVLALIGLGTTLAWRRLRQQRRAARDAQAAAERVQAFCETVAADLAAGQPPHQVLVRSATEFPEFHAAGAAARLASDVPAALRRLADRPGCGDLRLVAAAWQVAYRTGAGLAVALERVGGTIAERRRTSRLVAAELASAQATARLMAGLPVALLLAGSGLGGDPFGFLTGTAPGLGCLALGLVLSFAGHAWLQRIAGSVGAG